jgi:hypothetical protein
LGNKLFQLYIRLALEKFQKDKSELKAENLVKNLKISQETIQQAYTAIKTGEIKAPTAPQLLKEAFSRFNTLGTAAKINELKREVKSNHRETYLGEMLHADAAKMYRNWKTFIVKNVGIYLKEWATVKIEENRARLPAIAANHTRVTAAAALVRNAVLYDTGKVPDALGKFSKSLDFLKGNTAEIEFLQMLVDECRAVLNAAGVHTFPVAFYPKSAPKHGHGSHGGSSSAHGGGSTSDVPNDGYSDSDSEEIFEDADEEKSGFKDELAYRMLPLLSKIIDEMNSYALTRQDAMKDKPKKERRRSAFISKNKKHPEKWSLRGPFNRTLFPETSFDRVFVEVTNYTIVHMRMSIQRQRMGIADFSKTHPYTYTPSLLKAFKNCTVPVTYKGLNAEFHLGENSFKNTVHMAAVQSPSAPPLPADFPKTAMPLGDFLKRVDEDIVGGKGHVTPLSRNFTVSTGEKSTIQLGNYLLNAEAVALAKDIFNWKAL